MKYDKNINCEKCIHFIQHYSINNELGLISINCGHCRLMNKKSSPSFSCEQFKKIYKEKKLSELTPIYYLNKIEMQLKNIDRILKEIMNKY